MLVSLLQFQATDLPDADRFADSIYEIARERIVITSNKKMERKDIILSSPFRKILQVI